MKSTLDSYKLLHEGSLLLERLERNGMRIDEGYLNNTIQKIHKETSKIEKEVHEDEVYHLWKKVYGERTNIDSLPQLGEILYGKLKHPCTELTPTGKYKVDEIRLQQIDIPFIKTYFRRKKLLKVLDPYLNGYKRECVNGLIHPSFNLLKRTLRSSASDPNVQNVPNRGGVAPKLCRTCFIPRKGNVLVEIDYNTLEVRVGCAYHEDSVMIRYITDPKSDMHRDTAMKLFSLEEGDVQRKTTRDWTKSRFVFAEFYGSMWFQCAPSVWRAVEKDTSKLKSGLTIKEHLALQGITELGDCDPKRTPLANTFAHRCKQVEEDLWQNRFKGYYNWKNRFWREYCAKGGFFYKNGFWLSGLLVKNDVTNYPIQGVAFHCLLWSMIQLQKHLDRNRWKTKLISEIHDCLMADVPREELQDFIGLAKKIMTVDLVKHWPWLNVPLEVEIEVCEENWFDKKQWKEVNGLWQAA